MMAKYMLKSEVFQDRDYREYEFLLCGAIHTICMDLIVDMGGRLQLEHKASCEWAAKIDQLKC